MRKSSVQGIGRSSRFSQLVYADVSYVLYGLHKKNRCLKRCHSMFTEWVDHDEERQMFRFIIGMEAVSVLQVCVRD